MDGQVDLPFDESGLIREIQGGKTAVFSELIARYQDRLYNLAYRLTGSPEDAADLAQETLTRALKGLHQFRGHSRFYTWMVRIMINITNDGKSKAKRDRDFQQEMRAVLQQSQAARLTNAQDPQSQAQNREMVELLWRAIDQLDGPQKQVLLLRDLEQLSYEEVAQVLTLTEGTVKSRIFRARESLRETLAPVLAAKGGKEE